MEHQECVICFENLCSREACCLYNQSGIRVCRHYFHTDCMIAPSSVLQPRRSCPICRVEWTSIVSLPNPLNNPRAFFDMIDSDSSGCLNRNEVLEGLKACLDVDWRKIEQSVEILWNTWDKDKGGTISYAEMVEPNTGLLAYIIRNYPRSEVDRAREPPDLRQRPRDWFQYWDEDKSNSLEKEEIVRALVKTFRITQGSASVATITEVIDAVFCIFDPDGSGSIDINEFTMSDGLCDTIIASLSL